MHRCAVVAIARALCAGLALAAVSAQFVALVGRGLMPAEHFFSYFTIQSNLLGGGVLLVGAVQRGTVRGPVFDLVRGGAVLSLLVTGAVSGVLSRTGSDTPIPWVDAVVHRVMPAVLAFDWLVIPPVRRLAPQHGLLWLSYPLVWTAYTLVRGARSGWYPYPFLDPATVGPGTAARYSGAILLGMLLLAGLLVVVGNAARARWSHPQPAT